MKNLLALLFILMLFGSTSSTAQSQTTNETKFAIFIVSNIQTWDQAEQIDAFMRNQTGIIMSRQDVPSKRYYCHFDSNSTIDQETLAEWFDNFGMVIKCYSEGVYGTDPVPHETYQSCNE